MSKKELSKNMSDILTKYNTSEIKDINTELRAEAAQILKKYGPEGAGKLRFFLGVVIHKGSQ